MKAKCDSHDQAVMYGCIDSSCTMCENLFLLGDGMCGSGFDFFPSAKYFCPVIIGDVDDTDGNTDGDTDDPLDDTVDDGKFKIYGYSDMNCQYPESEFAFNSNECSRLAYKGTVLFVKASCQGNQAYAEACIDEDCEVCEEVDYLLKEGECGHGFGFFSSARYYCPSSTSSSYPTHQGFLTIVTLLGVIFIL